MCLPVAVTVTVAGPRTGITGHLGHVPLHESCLPKYKLAIPKNWFVPLPDPIGGTMLPLDKWFAIPKNCLSPAATFVAVEFAPKFSIARNKI